MAPQCKTLARTVREAMHEGCECIGENQSALEFEAAERIEQLDIGAMPICGQDDRLKGMITDRDIVVKVLAQDKDPANTMAGEFAQDRLVLVRADAPIDHALSLMQEHKVRRLPVLDDTKRLCGMNHRGGQRYASRGSRTRSARSRASRRDSRSRAASCRRSRL